MTEINVSALHFDHKLGFFGDYESKSNILKISEVKEIIQEEREKQNRLKLQAMEREKKENQKRLKIERKNELRDKELELKEEIKLGKERKQE